jgi:hypothetical protein
MFVAFCYLATDSATIISTLANRTILAGGIESLLPKGIAKHGTH